MAEAAAAERFPFDADGIRAALAGCRPAPAAAAVEDGCDPPSATRSPLALEPGTPALRSLYVYLTGGCNLACRHCWVAPVATGGRASGGHLPVATLLDICREAMPLGLGSVKLTGGEPLLHPELAELVRGLSGLGLGVWMESNLTLLTPASAAAIAASVSLLSTSLDAATAAAHDRFRGAAGSFAATCRAVEALAGHCRVQVIMSVHAGNVADIAAVVELAARLGASSVKFNLVHDGGRADRMRAAGGTLAVEELVRLGRWVERELAPRQRLPLVWSWPPAFTSLARLAAGGRSETCGVHHILGVLASGHYALCGIGETVDALVYGRVGDDLAALWHRHPALTGLRAALPDQLTGICRRCVHRTSCKAHCVAANYHTTGSLTAPHWFCAEADRVGLFPPSRLAAQWGREVV